MFSDTETTSTLILEDLQDRELITISSDPGEEREWDLWDKKRRFVEVNDRRIKADCVDYVQIWKDPEASPEAKKQARELGDICQQKIGHLRKAMEAILEKNSDKFIDCIANFASL